MIKKLIRTIMDWAYEGPILPWKPIDPKVQVMNLPEKVQPTTEDDMVDVISHNEPIDTKLDDLSGFEKESFMRKFKKEITALANYAKSSPAPERTPSIIPFTSKIKRDSKGRFTK